MNNSLGWHYALEGTSYGPINQDELDGLIANGTVRADTLVWQEGMDDWLPLGQMKGTAIPMMASHAPARENIARPREDASTFVGALKDGFSRYVDFKGRSNRPQFWFWTLWMIILGIGTGIIDSTFGFYDVGPINSILSLITLIPGIAVAARRLHDIGRRGWWLLLILIPIVGLIVLIVFFSTKGEETPNPYGDPV
ncbi:hypothetical protein C1J03_21555 [Sulfitobacter sp. SK012]|uniref:DUF805 domain-containing protein n=1 Tax=Sulfitobacter sp. SK012 TaxID=1389005 RepID=UPI000E0BEBDE|nr:DUF805 domain-containing protein [Sulfitobacter sp. SK012]AXI48350.1 hypothetical protein C1J03_21555 [Sulfitobacter sp. SK012]